MARSAMRCRASDRQDRKGFPPSSDYGPGENQQRHEDRAAFLNASPFWHRGTSFPHPEFADAPLFVHDAGIPALGISPALIRQRPIS